MEPRPYDMGAHQESIHIEASPERVFALIADLATSSEWAGSGQVKTIRKTSAGPIGPGTTYIADEKIMIPFKAVSEIVAYEPNRLVSWTSKPTLFRKSPPHRWMFRLDPENGGTRLTQEVRVATAVGYERFMQIPMVKLTGGMAPIQRGMKLTLQNLKARAEV